jgi:hypothetical protein
MNASTSSAVAILTLAILAGDVLAEPAAEPPSASRTTARLAETLKVGRLFERLLGKPKAEPEAAADEQPAPAEKDPANAAVAGEADAQEPHSSTLRFSPAAATPVIDLDARRAQGSEGRSAAGVRSASAPATQDVIELDETVTAQVAEKIHSGTNAASGSNPPANDSTGPRGDAATRMASRPIPAAAPKAPVITARPAPPPVQPPQLPTQSPAASPNVPGPAEPAPPAAAAPRRTSTSAFLADDVRFGPVRRKAVAPPAPAPRPVVEEERIEPQPAPKSLTTRTIVPSRLHVVPPPVATPHVTAEDFAMREPPRPLGSAAPGSGQPGIVEGAFVSPTASPGQILQAVLYYGAPLEPVALQPSPVPASRVPSPPVSPATSQRISIQPTPSQKPTLAEPQSQTAQQSVLATPPESSPARHVTRRAVRGKVLHGQVARVNKASGYAVVEFRGGAPAEGSQASVYRRHLFQRKHLGDVEIFLNSSGELCARPQGGLTLGALAIEDELIVLPQVIDGDHESQATESAPQL